LATAARTVTVKYPAGVVVSMSSVLLTKATWSALSLS
jgi:hypothetical protein